MNAESMSKKIFIHLIRLPLAARTRSVTSLDCISSMACSEDGGVFFGNTFMTRMSVFIERIWFLLTQWLHLGSA